MYLENALITSQPNFFNISLFICQLFIGGSFRVAQILCDPTGFDDRIIYRIDLECSFPRTFIDVTSAQNFKLNFNKRTDHILQLIFLSQGQSTEFIDRINELATFYRVFVISSNQKLDTDDHLSNKMRSFAKTSSSSLYLTYGCSIGGAPDVAFRSYQSSRDSNGEIVFQEKTFDSTFEDELFNDAFGRNAFIQTIGVQYVDELACNYVYKEEIFPNLKSQMIFANFYYLQMNLSFLEVTKLVCEENAIAFQHKWKQLLPNRLYKEMSKQFKPIDEQTK